MLLYSSPTWQYRHNWLHLHCWGRGQYGSINKLFCSGHFEIQDSRHIGYNLITISQRVLIGKLLQSMCVCVLCMRHLSALQNINMSRILTHVINIHQPVLHGNGRPVDRVAWYQHSAVDKIKDAIIDHSNTFAVEGVRLHNMTSLVYDPDEFLEQILNSNDTGQNMYEDYVTARINGHVILLAKEMKVGNKIVVSGSKTTVIKFRDNTW